MNRIDPQMGPEGYKTYAIVAPLQTHFRPATCSQIGCQGYTNGFETRLLPDDPRTDYIRRRSGRRFTETRDDDGMVVFAFPAGQQCFRASEHRMPLEREPFYIVKGGDHRGDPTGMGTSQYRAADWVDHFAEHQDRIVTAQGRG